MLQEEASQALCLSAERVFHLFDTDRDCLLNFAEFRAAAVTLLPNMTTDKLYLVFKARVSHFNQDALSINQFREAMKDRDLVEQALRGDQWLSSDTQFKVIKIISRLWIRMQPKCTEIAKVMDQCHTAERAWQIWSVIDDLEDAFVGGDAQVLLRCYLAVVSLTTSTLCANIDDRALCEGRHLGESLSELGSFLLGHAGHEMNNTKEVKAWGRLLDFGSQWNPPELANLQVDHPLKLVPLDQETFGRKRVYAKHNAMQSPIRNTTLTPYPEEKAFRK